MTRQRDLTLIAASVGFVSAFFFSIGSISMGAKEICLQAIPFFDFSEPLGRTLITQRAQNIVGSIFLVLAFTLQIVAGDISLSAPSLLPQWLRS
jgi:hypothetical protein